MYFDKAAELAEQGATRAGRVVPDQPRQPAADARPGRCGGDLPPLPRRRPPHRRPHIVANATSTWFALLDLGEWDEVASCWTRPGTPTTSSRSRWPVLFAAASRGDADPGGAALARSRPPARTRGPAAPGRTRHGRRLLALAEGRTADVLRLGSRDVPPRHPRHRLGRDAACLAGRRPGPPCAAGSRRGRRVLAVLDGELPGQPPAVLRPSCELVRARRAVVRGDAVAGEQLRRPSAPCGARARRTCSPMVCSTLRSTCPGQGDAAAAAVAVAEAREIGERLGCRPVLDRADQVAPTRSRQGV